MSPRYIGLDPTQVIWSNLRIKWWERVIRNSGAIAFVVALIIFWSIPVAVVGAISNINYLTEKVPFLRFIDHVPSWIKGVITGLLPSVMQAVLMALVPIIMRIMAKLGGAPNSASVELFTQNSYFAFQVVQTFLVLTLASSASSVVSDILQDPTSAAPLLADKIPTASNFYISYITLQGLSFSAGALVQLGGLIVGKILGKFLDSTPRKMYKRWSSLAGLGWGTVYPAFTFLAVIGKLRSFYDFIALLTFHSYHLLLCCSSGSGILDNRFVLVLLRLPIQRAVCLQLCHRHPGSMLRPRAATPYRWMLHSHHLFGCSVCHWLRRRPHGLGSLGVDDHLPRLHYPVPHFAEWRNAAIG